jgi:hypothetical protein
MGCISSTTSSCSNYAVVRDSKIDFPLAPEHDQNDQHHHHRRRRQQQQQLLLQQQQQQKKKYPIYGPDAIMNRKRHGTSDVPVQKDLRWDIPRDMADRICNFNYGMAEHRGTKCLCLCEFVCRLVVLCGYLVQATTTFPVWYAVLYLQQESLPIRHR